MLTDLDTPSLLLDVSEAGKNYKYLQNKLPFAKFFYAVKAFADKKVIINLLKNNSGFDVASKSELDLVLECGTKPENIILSNPIKSVDTIEYFYAKGVRCFVTDSKYDTHNLAKCAPGSTVLVRISVDNFGSDVPQKFKFGVRRDEAIKLIADIEGYGLKVGGVSFHVGSQSHNSLAWTKALQEAKHIIENTKARGEQTINIGGGFPANYTYDNSQSLASICDTIHKFHNDNPHINIFTEPGRFIVNSAGIMLASVLGRRDVGEGSWLYLDVGVFNGFMEALETNCELRFPVKALKESRSQSSYTLAGPTCDAKDVIMHSVALPSDMKPGDRLLIYGAGAYTLVYSSNFNGFDAPKTVYVDHTNLI